MDAGLAGHAPAALVQPIVRQLMTVGDLRKAIDGLDDSVWVIVNGTGPLNKTHKELGANEPWVLLAHLTGDAA